MIHCDTLIKNGNICDGTGNEVYVSDIAIKNGVIIAVGPNLQTSHDELIDATGLLVTPGFVDVHTHYDGQITWVAFIPLYQVALIDSHLQIGTVTKNPVAYHIARLKTVHVFLKILINLQYQTCGKKIENRTLKEKLKKNL